MDIDISSWILEFLLKNSVDERLLSALFRVLPVPNNNPSFNKNVLLRLINSDAKRGTISERTLELLEQIEELDSREGNHEVSEAMKAAYCTIALHCTLQCVEESADDKKGTYFSAVKRIWRARVCTMERFDAAKRVGLVSDDLLSLMDNIEAAVWDQSVYENILAKYKDMDVSDVVYRYVNEAKEKMGPSFLELAAEVTLKDEGLSEIMGLDRDGGPNKDGAPNVVSDANAKINETCKENVESRCKHTAVRRPRGRGFGTHRGVKIVDTTETSSDNYNGIPTPEINKAREALETSTFELKAVVKDPLPDALRLAQSLKAKMAEKNMAPDCELGNPNMANVGPPQQANVNHLDDGFHRDHDKRPNVKLWERNHTAHTMEWDDSIDDNSKKGSPTRALRMDEIKRLSKMRKRKRWSTVEEDTLRTGVQKYGKGNWKLILSMYRDIFVDRTEVDLKDKWRNLVR